MKYTKPNRNTINASLRLEEFLDSLPDSFTVLEEVWPKELTRERLSRIARDLHDVVTTCGGEACNPSATAGRNAIEALAAIAPGPRKRKVTLWQRDDGMRYWGATPPVGQEWERRGECEIEEG